MIYFSPSTLGFYRSDIHGPRTLVVIDPQWQHPMILVPDPEWVAQDHPDESVPLIEVPDPDVVPPTIEVQNGNCKIPPDAVEISSEQWAELQAGQQTGRALEADESGQPVLSDPPPPRLVDLTPRQLKQALTRLGLRAQVEAAIAAGDQDLKDWWFESLSFERDHALVEAMRVQLSKTAQEVDAVWQLGASL